MSTFYICSSCGYPKDNHHFRHKFSEIKVNRNKNDNEDSFTVDAHYYDSIKTTKCGKTGCNGVIGIHNTIELEHSYIPVEYSYRNIQIVLPLDAICNNCKITIEKHDTVMTHHFSTNLLVQNKQDTDRVVLINPIDEDKKIIFNS